ncbi:MAG: GTP pyrophosphokinase family protein [Clostridiales bacterium]|nr:GTP pyrophosphokinase family protein [Clostridiales bacterium]
MDTNLSDNGNLNPNPNSELHLSTVNVPNLAQVPDDFGRQAKEFQRALMMYSCAIREVKTKLEVLNDDLSIRNQRNPIELIKSRVKKPSSIVGKLRRKGYPVTVESMMGHLDDVAGIRVICSFLDEIYTVADMLVRQDDVKVVTVKDYIKNPKPNGYRSYHLILEIPVYFSDEKKNMRVEVQIRTIAMDFWASLDHQLKYKKDIVQDSQQITEELRQCADVIANTDQQMLRIRKNIEQQGGIVMVD